MFERRLFALRQIKSATAEVKYARERRCVRSAGA